MLLLAVDMASIKAGYSARRAPNSGLDIVSAEGDIAAMGCCGW